MGVKYFLVSEFKQHLNGHTYAIGAMEIDRLWHDRKVLALPPALNCATVEVVHQPVHATEFMGL